uniref:acyltransferase n=1 Tax=Flavobacterium sp. TaxID=239 RepID=UPI00404B466B
MKKKMRVAWHIIKELWKVNWTKTIYFNFKKFPFEIAKKLPFFFYGKITFTDISGKIQINHEIKTGMIAFGKTFVKNKANMKISEVSIAGTLTFDGFAQFGKDCFLSVGKNGVLKFGKMTTIGNNSKIVCEAHMNIGDYVQFGPECYVVDSNFHPMIDTISREKFKMEAAVNIGTHNFFITKVSIMPGTRTPDYCTVAIHSLLNKDYTSWGENILMGGIPAKLLRQNTTRDWEGESKLFENLKKFY